MIKRFYVNNIKSYPHEEDLYLFKKDLVNKIRRTSLDLDLRSVFTYKNLLINNILELTINGDRKLIEAAITLYNEFLYL